MRFLFQANRITEVAGYDVNLVLDSTVGRIMNEVDLVVFGAEGVVENGGIINTVGTYQIAIGMREKRERSAVSPFPVANLHNVPVYVVAESFKFVRHFPLSQNDVPQFRDVSILEGLLVALFRFAHRSCRFAESHRKRCSEGRHSHSRLHPAEIHLVVVHRFGNSHSCSRERSTH